MDSSKNDLLTEIRRAGIKLDDTTPEGINAISRKLGEVEFETVAGDHSISVWMTGNGKLSDVIIDDEKLGELDAQEASANLTTVIIRAENTLHDVIRSLQMQELRQPQ